MDHRNGLETEIQLLQNGRAETIVLDFRHLQVDEAFQHLEIVLDPVVQFPRITSRSRITSFFSSISFCSFRNWWWMRKYMTTPVTVTKIVPLRYGMTGTAIPRNDLKNRGFAKKTQQKPKR